MALVIIWCIGWQMLEAWDWLLRIGEWGIGNWLYEVELGEWEDEVGETGIEFVRRWGNWLLEFVVSWWCDDEENLFKSDWRVGELNETGEETAFESMCPWNLFRTNKGNEEFSWEVGVGLEW